MNCSYCNAKISGDLPTTEWKYNNRHFVVHNYCLDSFIEMNKNNLDLEFVKALRCLSEKPKNA